MRDSFLQHYPDAQRRVNEMRLHSGLRTSRKQSPFVLRLKTEALDNMEAAHSVWQRLARLVRPAALGRTTVASLSSAASPTSSASTNRVHVDMTAGSLTEQMRKRHSRLVRPLAHPHSQDGDGNLLFRVLFDVLMHGAEDPIVPVEGEGEADGHGRLRSRLCYRLRAMYNEAVYHAVIDRHVAFISRGKQQFGEYVSKMSAPGQRGSYLEMWAFCFEFQCNVRISYPKPARDVDELLLTSNEQTQCPALAVFDIGWVAASGQTELTKFVSTQRKTPAFAKHVPFMPPPPKIKQLGPQIGVPNQDRIVPKSPQLRPGKGMLHSRPSH